LSDTTTHHKEHTVSNSTSIPAWVKALPSPARDEIIATLTADELCACGCRDDEHDSDSFCVHNTDDDTFGEPHACYAYNPVQR